MWYRLCAERKPILHLGRVLLKPPLVDRKGFQDLGFGALLGTFPGAGKVLSPEAGQANPTTDPPSGRIAPIPRLVAVFGVLLTPRVPVAADRIVAAAAV